MTLPAVPGKFHYLEHIAWSYSGVPAGGKVSVDDDGTTVIDVDVMLSGKDHLDVETRSAAMGTVMAVTLGSAGISLIGKLVVQYHDD